MGVSAARWPLTAASRAGVELSVIALYAFCVLYLFFDGEDDTAWTAAVTTPMSVFAAVGAAVLWLLFLVRFVFGLVRSSERLRYVGQNVGTLCLLAAVFFTYATWLPAVSVALLLLAFILEIRKFPGDREWLTAAVLILFISSVLTVAIVLVEDDAEESELGSWGQGFSWALARLMRANIEGLEDISPVTRDGQDLAAVLTICATLLAALLIGGIIKWLLGKPDEPAAPDADASEAVVVLTDEVVALRATIEELRSDLSRAEQQQAGPRT